MRAAAILPSRNEASTIAAVTTAVDTALSDRQAVIVLADSSDTPATAHRFAATTTLARTLAITGMTRGKGTQILAAARHPSLATVDALLIADTDTRNPHPAAYRALLDTVHGGAELAIADYPRYWDEANLTHHLVRPLIAATTGHDIPQPIAGDLALSARVLTAAQATAARLPPSLHCCVDGYGIDVFLLLTAADLGPIATVPVSQPKQHAPSFPHLPAIYHQATPALLHLTAHNEPPRHRPPTAVYQVTDRSLPPERLTTMLSTLTRLIPHTHGYDEPPWPEPVAAAWHAIRTGTPADEAARTLWPHYLRRVRRWLTEGHNAAPHQRAADLAAAHSRLTMLIQGVTA